MVNRKLAALLMAAITLGQTGMMMSLFAQAETAPPLFSPEGSPASRTNPSAHHGLQVASVIRHPDGEGAYQDPLSVGGAMEASDVYYVSHGEGTLKTLIQSISQGDDTGSLFINTTEILRFQGTVNQETAYERVRKVAERLHERLSAKPDAASRIRPIWRKNDKGAMEALLTMDGETLAVVDAKTVHAAQEEAPKLAFLYANRLRRSLGVTPIHIHQFPYAAGHPIATTCPPAYKSTGRKQTGMASWYGGFFHGRRAADGSRFNQHALTAAHKTLPFGTIVRVSNQRTHKSCFVKITDRGPYAHGRIIDLSRGAAKAIGMLGSGVARVSLEVVRPRG